MPPHSPPPDSAEAPRRPALRWAALLVGLVAAILVPFLLFASQLETWTSAAFTAMRGEPWLGGALIVGLLVGDVVLPVPSSIVSTFAGGAFGWRIAAGVIWLGMTLGCVAAYLLGMTAGRGVALRVVGAKEMARAQRLFDGAGPLTLIVTRAVPVLSEASVLAAGAARMPFGPFLAATSVANLGVAMAYAGVGAAAASAGSFLLAFMGLVAVPALAWAAWRSLAARRSSRTES